MSPAFVARFTSPVDACGFGATSFAQFLARAYYRGRRTASELLERLRAASSPRATAEHFGAAAGMSLSVVQSGTRTVAWLRRGRDHRLRDDTGTLAGATCQWHPWAIHLHARGDDHPRATRTLGRTHSRVVWRC